MQQLAQCHIETTSVTVAKCKRLALYTPSFALPLVHSRVIRSRGALPPPEVLAPNVLLTASSVRLSLENSWKVSLALFGYARHHSLS
jgi:hypothetical protein